MSPKRIRCDCGRVYDPAKHPNCPDCGTPRPQLIVAEPPKPEPPPEPRRVPRQRETVPPPVPPGPRPGQAITMRHIIGGAAIVVGLLTIFLVVRPKPQPGHATAKVDHSPAPATTATPVPTVAPTARPTATAIVRNETTPVPTPAETALPITPPPPTAVPSFDLAGAIAAAASGGTVKIPAGVYRGGFVVRQSLHLVGEAKEDVPVVIQSEGKRGLVVEARGVSVANVQFVAQGVGELPAVSVAKGAELKLDGCKLLSSTSLGATVAQDGSIEAAGSSFSATKGAAVRLEAGAKGDFNQSSFQNSLVGVSLTSGATAELHACSFENDGMNSENGATIALAGDNTQLTADDCHLTTNTGGISVSKNAGLTLANSSFKSNGGSYQGVVGLLVISDGGNASLTNDKFESNRSGVLVTRGGKLEMEKCSFDKNGFAQSRGVVAGSLALSIAGEGSTGVVRHTTFSRSTPYAASVIAGGKLTLEETEISGSAEVGLLVGDRSAPGGQAEIKSSHFLGNVAGLGICAGSVARVDDSEFRDNNDGIVVLDPKSDLRLTKSKLLGNHRQGLHVFEQATATVSDSDVQDNIQGALSGTIGKATQRASITLENCRFGRNHVFAAGAGRDSELVLNNCTFDGTDKSNLFKDRGARVTMSGSPGESPSPQPSAAAENSKRPHHRATPKPHLPKPEDIERTLRKLLPGGD